MTGFGKSSSEVSHKKIIVEIKSLNSKQLDLSIRLPQTLREKEALIRNQISRTLERGKIDVVIYQENESEELTSKFNITTLKSYKEQIEILSQTLNIPLPNDWYSILLRLPDVLKLDSDSPDEEESSALNKSLSNAIESLNEFRKKEGEKLEVFFTQRINAIEELLALIDNYENERICKIRQKIEENLNKLLNVEIDRGRLEQELIYYIEKLDVNEEKQRLAQHLKYFIETMKGPAGQGKKLGFISQEMGREINTLGSKSNHAEMQKIVVRMKDELEQIKEQVLNVL